MLIFKTPVVAESMPVVANEGRKKSSFSFKEWYQANKIRLSEKKAKRYKEDEKYRTAIITRSKNQRLKKKNPDLPIDKTGEMCHN